MRIAYILTAYLVPSSVALKACAKWDDATTLLERWKYESDAEFLELRVENTPQFYSAPLSPKAIQSLQDTLVNALYYPLLSSLVSDPVIMRGFLTNSAESLCALTDKDYFSSKEFKCKTFFFAIRPALKALFKKSPTLWAIKQTLQAQADSREAQEETMLRVLALTNPEAFDELARQIVWSPMATPPVDFSPDFWNMTLQNLTRGGYL